MTYNKMFYWSEDDHAFITNVPSLPGCMADGAAISESLQNADIASYILDKLNAIDTWMLQKLVYYCQAWCLGIYKTVFINDTFKDYANGPVNKKLFDTHKSRRIVRKSMYPLSHSFSESEMKHMDNII